MNIKTKHKKIMLGLGIGALATFLLTKEEQPLVDDYTNMTQLQKNIASNLKNQETENKKLTDISEKDIYEKAIEIEEQAMKRKKTIKSYTDEGWKNIATDLVTATTMYNLLLETNSEYKELAAKRLQNIEIDAIAQEFPGSCIELGDNLLVFKEKIIRRENSYISTDIKVEAYDIIRTQGEKDLYVKINLPRSGPFSKTRTITLDNKDYNLNNLLE